MTSSINEKNKHGVKMALQLLSSLCKSEREGNRENVGGGGVNVRLT